MHRAPDHAPSLVLERVDAGYEPGRAVLAGLDVRIDGPGLVRVAGPNGSGKSTFVELVSGYLRPWAGTVTVNGSAAHAPGARAARRVCRTQVALYARMTAADHLAFGARAAAADVSEQLERADRYGLGPWLQTAAADLSTGNARKLWLVLTTGGAFALAVLDEPFNGLDDEGRTVLLDELDRWRAGRRIVLVAHEPPAGLPEDDVLELAGPRTPARRSA